MFIFMKAAIDGHGRQCLERSTSNTCDINEAMERGPAGSGLHRPGSCCVRGLEVLKRTLDSEAENLGPSLLIPD